MDSQTKLAKSLEIQNPQRLGDTHTQTDCYNPPPTLELIIHQSNHTQQTHIIN